MAAMRFGAWLAARRVPRVAFIAGFLELGLLNVLSTATVILVAITRGWRVAVTDCLIAAAVLIGINLATGGVWQVAAAAAGTLWPVAIALGSLTGHFATLTLPIQGLLVLTAVLVVVFTLGVGDPAAYWTRILQSFAEELQGAGVELGNAEVLASWAPLMTGLMASMAVLTLVLALVLGSWWAGAAGGPAFGTMFRRLRLGNVLGGAAAIAGIASLAGGGQLASDLLLVLATGFSLQGLAVVHWHAKVRNLAWPVLLVVYLLMFPWLVGPGIAGAAWLAVAAVGFVDNWFVLRRGDENMV